MTGYQKRKILRRAGYVCENPHCDAECTTIHHLKKKSTDLEETTEYVALCGACHAELERRLREGEPIDELLPYRLRSRK